MNFSYTVLELQPGLSEGVCSESHNSLGRLKSPKISLVPFNLRAWSNDFSSSKILFMSAS